jgi:2-iminobutanoate/2-iminopropanoate deaminase/2-aminomuconate deaminase
MPHKLEVVQPKPEDEHRMPYAPAVSVIGAADLMFVSGATPSPLYHDHPHIESQHNHPCDIIEQTEMVMANLKTVLDKAGAKWSDVVKITKYLTDMRDFDGLHRVLNKHFGKWHPASTTICVNQLSSPGARIEIDLVVALPKK